VDDFVMAGFIPAIHVLFAAILKDVDGRHKAAGHDEINASSSRPYQQVRPSAGRGRGPAYRLVKRAYIMAFPHSHSIKDTGACIFQ